MLCRPGILNITTLLMFVLIVLVVVVCNDDSARRTIFGTLWTLIVLLVFLCMKMGRMNRVGLS